MADDIDDADPLALSGRLFDGRYHVAEKVGDGGMAIVYRARDTVTRKRNRRERTLFSAFHRDTPSV